MIEFSTCLNCPRSNGLDFCFEYKRMINPKQCKIGPIPSWCKKRKFTFVRRKKDRHANDEAKEVLKDLDVQPE